MYEVKMYRDSSDYDGTRIHYDNASKIKLISGNIAKGINVIDSFTFTMNMNNPAYNSIETFKTLITVKNRKTGALEFDGYVQRQNGNMSDNGQYTKEVSCVSVLNYLKDSLAGYGEFHDMTPKAFFTHLIDVHNKQVEPHKQFTVRDVDVTNTTDNLYRYTSQEADVFETIMDKLIDRLGGELRVERFDDKLYIDWLKNVGEVKEQTEIRVGKNLKSASRDEETDDIKTRWVILGSEIEKEDNEEVGEDDAYAAKERVSIASVNGGKDYLDDTIAIAQFGIKKGVKVFDGVSNKNTLMTKGKNFITNNKLITISNQVTALDLSVIGKDIDSFEVFNWYPLNNPALAAKENVRVIEKRIDIISPQSSSLTLGDTYLAASKYQAALRKNQQAYAKIEGKVDSLMKSRFRDAKELETAKEQITAMQEQLKKSNIDTLPQELQTVLEGLEEVKSTLDSLVIPEYGLATGTENGLMSVSDKQKLDLILATKITDLDELTARVEALETPPEIPPKI